MNSFTNELQHRLAARREQNLFRELRRVDSAAGPRIEMGERSFLNFSSNDYLGLASHPALKSAATRAVEMFGSGAGASRLICGSLAPFHELEETLAAFKCTEAALSFSTGYAAATGAISALMGSDDVIILDKLVHACIVDAARLSGAKLRIFDHNDLNDLAEKLNWAAGRRRTPNQKSHTLIVTESVFSMDGDRAPLREIVALKEQHGAWLMVDEAHATGILGRNGRGLADELGVSSQIDIQMGTLGKALGASGGYICGSRELVDFLINHARSFIFSTAPVPAAAAAATAGIRVIQSSEGDALRKSLFERVRELTSSIEVQPSAGSSAIVPFMIGDEKAATTAAEQLREQHIFIPAIRYPTVARGAARLRITLSAAHSRADVDLLIRGLNALSPNPESPAE
jgi:8-amino-7-oxononanoate synthase